MKKLFILFFIFGTFHIFGQDLHLYNTRTNMYLGCVTCNQFHPNSIWNQFGTYGSLYSPNSIWNPYGINSSYFRNDIIVISPQLQPFQFDIKQQSQFDIKQPFQFDIRQQFELPKPPWKY